MSWLVRLAPRPGRPVVIACPYAGGGPAVFRAWAADPQVEVHAVCLPGRDRRLAEAPVAPAVAAMAVAQAALAVAGDRPIAVHGHSAGACLATLVAAALHRAGRPPIWLGVAAMTAPGVPTPPLAHLPSAPLWAELERRYGVPPGGRTPPELHELVEPALRADLELVETWQPPAQAVCPVVAIAATGDAVATPAAMQGWVGWAGGRARFDVIAGDHWAALAPAVLARLISPVGPSAAPP